MNIVVDDDYIALTTEFNICSFSVTSPLEMYQMLYQFIVNSEHKKKLVGRFLTKE